jgi:hypothetical protein
MKTIDFLNVLFDEGELTCFAKDAKGTRVYSALTPPAGAEFFCINPLDSKDNNPTQEWHSAHSPRRADCNVTKFRNILIEMDNIELEVQLNLIKESGLPFTTAVYSGGKSIHFIISLETALTSKDEYTALVCKVYKALNFIRPGAVDKANKNPSRLSRLANSLRKDKIKIQKLLVLGSRVKNKILLDWIEENCPQEVLERPISKTTAIYNNNGRLSPWARNVLMGGVQAGERNVTCFRLACEFAKLGMDSNEAFGTIASITDLPKEELKATIKSAYSYVKAS